MPETHDRRRHTWSNDATNTADGEIDAFAIDPLTTKFAHSLVLVGSLGPGGTFEEIEDPDICFAGIMPAEPPRRSMNILSTLRHPGRRSSIDDSCEEEVVISSVTQAGGTPPAMLRRFIHRIENQKVTKRALSKIEAHKSRSASTTKSTSTRNPQQTERGEAKGEVRAETTTRGRDSTRRLRRSGKKTVAAPALHKRTHSDQPRIWREPGAALWPVEEE